MFSLAGDRGRFFGEGDSSGNGGGGGGGEMVLLNRRIFLIRKGVP